MPTFSIPLASTNEEPQRIFFSDTDETKEFSCEKEEDQMICKANSTTFSDNTVVSVYYKNDCGQLINTNLQFTFYIAQDVAVESIAFSSSITCHTDPTNISMRTLKIVHSENNNRRTIFNATIEKKDGTQFTYGNCWVDSTTVTYCESTEVNLSYGTYKLVHIEGINNLIIGDDVNILSLETESFSPEQSKKAQTVKKSSPTFSVDLITDSVLVPDIYAGDDKTKKISCEKKDNHLECTPEATVMPESKSYDIYYRKPCTETLTSTGITVMNILPRTITVSDIAVKETTDSCVTSDITEIVLTVDLEPSGDVKYLLLRKNKVDFKFQTCSSTETTITCSGITLTESGEYDTIEVSGDDTYITNALTKK